MIDQQPAAKGRLDQRLGVGLLHLGEYVEVLVEAPVSRKAIVSSRHWKLWLWEAVEGNDLDFNFCRIGNYIRAFYFPPQVGINVNKLGMISG